MLLCRLLPSIKVISLSMFMQQTEENQIVGEAKHRMKNATFIKNLWTVLFPFLSLSISLQNTLHVLKNETFVGFE